MDFIKLTSKISSELVNWRNLQRSNCYLGQQVLFMIRRTLHKIIFRTFKRTPVQRTKLGASAHTHPVYSIDVIGSQNAHNVISVSTDGKLCSWSLDMFSKPQVIKTCMWGNHHFLQECLELQAKANQKSVSVTALAFPGDSVNNFIVGSEDGIIYSGQRHANKKVSFEKKIDEMSPCWFSFGSFAISKVICGFSLVYLMLTKNTGPWWQVWIATARNRRWIFLIFSYLLPLTGQWNCGLLKTILLFIG